MLAGAVAGWAVLSPLAHERGWAPGEVDDWERLDHMDKSGGFVSRRACQIGLVLPSIFLWRHISLTLPG
jgi:hypothetical protein